jgi:hypothetical protein
MPLERGEVIGGVFEIERSLESEYGVTTYRARHLMTGRPARVRVLAPSKCPWANRILENVDQLAELDSDGLARCVGHGRVGRSQVFLAFEWVKGETVADLLPAPLDRALVLVLASNVAHGLAELHAMDLPHGHVRPERIVVDARGDRGPVLLDGALPLPDGLELGLASYMAPETFAEGGEFAPASDIYALGATLYHALFGRPPHPGKTRVAGWLRATFDARGPLAELERGEPFFSWIGRMLSPEPFERPRAERIATVAIDALEGRPVQRVARASSVDVEESGAIVLLRGFPWNDGAAECALSEAVREARARLVRFVDGVAALKLAGAIDAGMGDRLARLLEVAQRHPRVATAGGPVSLEHVGRDLDAIAETFALTPAGQERFETDLMVLVSEARGRLAEVPKKRRRSTSEVTPGNPGGTLELPKRGRNGTLVMDLPDAEDEEENRLTHPGDAEAEDRPTIEVPLDPQLVEESRGSQRAEAKTIKDLKATVKMPKRRPTRGTERG